MTPEEIQAMAKGLAQGQAVWYVLSACIGGAITGLGAYLAEKGKNRATKEDIRDITRAVKEVEAGFNEKLADLQAHHQLRMVAAERRLQAHQEGFTHCIEMSSAISITHRAYEESLAALNWYNANAVFLGEKSRVAFSEAYDAAINLTIHPPGDVERNPSVNMAKILAAKEILIDEVNLPRWTSLSPEKLVPPPEVRP